MQAAVQPSKEQDSERRTVGQDSGYTGLFLQNVYLFIIYVFPETFYVL